MSYHCCNVDKGDSVPHGVIFAPGSNNFIAINTERAENAFGLGAASGGDGAEAWFPWGGGEEHTEGPFKALTRNKHYRYSWVPAHKVAVYPEFLQPVEVEGIAPACFDGRLGKISLSTQEGWTSYAGEEVYHQDDDVNNALVLCARSKHSCCPNGTHTAKIGHSPPADALKAPSCQFHSYVALNRDLGAGTFGRASADLTREGLEAWFPYGGKEHAPDSFELLHLCEIFKLYWAPVSEVDGHPDRHEVYKLGDLSPCVINNTLGKACVESLEGWTSYDGEEIVHDRDEVLAGKVLCYKEHEVCDE